MTNFADALHELDGLTHDIADHSRTIIALLDIFDPATGTLLTPDDARVMVHVDELLASHDFSCSVNDLDPKVAAVLLKELLRLRFMALAAAVRKNRELCDSALVTLDTTVESLAP